jgi:hypothetical protein
MHELAAPANINQVVKFELWKMAWCTYKKQLEARCHNSVRVYVLIMGACKPYATVWRLMMGGTTSMKVPM